MISTKYTYDVNKPEFREGEYSYTHPDMQETMWSAIPLDLANTKYIENIHRVSSLELERISAALDVVKRNMFLAVADDNGLNLWEQYTGLPPEIIEITSELRRRYLQAKMTGRHYFLGYHFTEGLELIGGPIRQIYYDPVAVEARILFKEPLPDPQLAKIEYLCGQVGLDNSLSIVRLGFVLTPLLHRKTNICTRTGQICPSINAELIVRLPWMIGMNFTRT